MILIFSFVFGFHALCIKQAVAFILRFAGLAIHDETKRQDNLSHSVRLRLGLKLGLGHG